MKYLLLVAASLALVVLLIAYIAWRMAFYSPTPRREQPYVFPRGKQYQEQKGRMTQLMQELEALPFEPVSIRAFDGLELYGAYYHYRDGAPVQIQFHGYRGTSLRDFCGGHKLARESGQNILLIHQRSHGKSQGHCISFGAKERYDCLAWANYVTERFGADTKIILAGVSMGAATVLLALDLPLPESVKCVIADCPYSSAGAIIRKVCADIHLPPRLMYPFARLAARLFGGFSLEDADVLKAVSQAKLPVLLIHGMGDKFIPYQMSEDIAKACSSPLRLELFPQAGHGLSYMLDTPRYEQSIKDFLRSSGIN